MDISKLLGLAPVFFAASTFFSCADVGGVGRGDIVLGRSSSPFTLQTLDGETRRLSSIVQAHRATILVFWSPSCPCVRRYQGRIDALLERYAALDVAVLAVASNAGENREMVAEATKERNVQAPVLMDKGGLLAAYLGARTTPTTAVLDGKGRLRFLGWIDNERLPGEDDRIAYVEQAVDGVLAAHNDFRARSRFYGCPITKPLGGSGVCLDPPAH